MNKAIQIITTVSSNEDASKLASILIDKKVAACVQIDGPITSIYRWQNNIENTQEWRLTIKSLATLFNDIERLILENHPYDTPEIIASEISQINDKFLEWIRSETTS